MRRVHRSLLVLAGALLATALALPAAASPPDGHGHGNGHAVTKITFKLDDHYVDAGVPLTSTVLVRTRAEHQWATFPDASLSIRVDGVEVGTVTSDGDGVAPVSYTPADVGMHVMRVVFEGDDTHKRARRAQGFEVAAATAPDAPILTGAPGVPVTSPVSLSWSVPDDGGSPITGYKVYRGETPGSEVFLVDVTTTSYDDIGSTSGITYSYVVTAVNAVDESVWSNEVTVTAA
jgi:hypothetical protein